MAREDDRKGMAREDAGVGRERTTCSSSRGFAQSSTLRLKKRRTDLPRRTRSAANDHLPSPRRRERAAGAAHVRNAEPQRSAGPREVAHLAPH